LELSVHKLEGAEFRKKSGTSAKERAQVEAAVIEHVERYLTIEEILELDSAEWHRPQWRKNHPVRRNRVIMGQEYPFKLG